MSKKGRWQIVLVGVLAAVSLGGGLAARGQPPNSGSMLQAGTQASANPSKRSTQKTSEGGQRGVKLAEPEPAASISVGPYYALVIGINDYRAPLPKLKTAVYDATEVARMLQDHYGFQPPKVLRNPTRKEIMLALNQYRHSLPAKSNLLIYYAGHGQEDQKTKQAYWLPADADLESDVNWISASTITQEISGIPAQHILVVSDSCYSGGLARSIPPLSIKPGEREAYFRKMLESPSRTLMASGRDEPVADDGTAGHSKFAYVLLASLLQIEDDRFTAAYLFQTYIQQGVAGEVGSQQVPQYSPIQSSGHEWGDFVFNRKAGDKRPSPAPNPIGMGSRIDTNRTSRLGVDHSNSAAETTTPSDSNANDRADRDAITNVIRSYAEAYSREDENALWKLWPTATLAEKTAIQNTFIQAKSITWKLSDLRIQIMPDGEHASVIAQAVKDVVTKQGNALPPLSRSTTFNLERQNNAWFITSVM